MSYIHTDFSRRSFLKLSAGALVSAGLLGGLSGCGASSAAQGAPAAAAKGSGVVNIYTWQGYVPPDVVTRFQDETGISINYSYFSTNEEMLAKLEATKGAEYDVILSTDYGIDIANKEGLVKKLDLSRLPNIKNIDPRLRNQYYDPDGDLSIPFWISSSAILYNPAKTDLKFNTFGDLADPSLKNNVVVTDSSRDLIGTSLATIGFDFNTTDVKEIEQVRPFLEKLRPSIKAFNTDSPEFVVTAGDAIASFHTGAQAVAGLLEDPSLEVAYPKEATTLAIDALWVPSQAPNLDNAYTFLDWYMQGDVAAQAVDYTHYHNANITDEYKKGIQSLVDSNSVAIIPDEILDDFVLSQSLPAEAQTLYNEIWTEFKQDA